jgi:PST family polysaccharide transporter
MAQKGATDLSGIRPDLKRLSIRGGAISLGAQGVQFLLQLISLIVLARLLAPADFGLLAIATFFTGFLAVFGDLGLVNTIIQRHDLNDDQLSALFWINLTACILLAITAAGLAPLVAKVYGQDNVMPIILVLALTFPLSGAAAQHRAILARRMLYGRLKGIEIIAAASAIVMGIVLASQGFGYWALVMMMLARSAVALVLLWWTSAWRPAAPRMVPGTGSLLKFGLELTGFNALNYVSRNADNALIGWVWGPVVLGFYNRAYALLTTPLQQLNQPLGSVTVATLSRLNSEPEAYTNAYGRVAEKILLLTMPLAGLMLATSDLVIAVLLGPRWADSAPIFFWLAIAALYHPLSQTTGWLFITQGRGRDMLIWACISTPLVMIFFLIGLPYGAVGVAAAYVIGGSLIIMPSLLWFVGRRGPVSTKFLVRLLATFLVLAATAGSTAYAARVIWGTGAPFHDILISWIPALLLTAVATFALGRTRAAAIDVFSLIGEFGKRNKASLTGTPKPAD